MSHEFAPPTVTHVSAEIVGVNKKALTELVDRELKGDLLKKHNIMLDVYGEYGATADAIDDRDADRGVTLKPVNRQAVDAAALLSVACVRGAQVSVGF